MNSRKLVGFGQPAFPLSEIMEVIIVADNAERIIGISNLIYDIYRTMGIELTDSTQNTPNRVARMWVNEIFRNYTHPECKEELDNQMTIFPNTAGSNMIITVVPFHAFCEHHLLPFSGKMAVGYVPDGKIIGLSKVPRIVDYFCHQPQLQETLCRDVAQYLYKVVNPEWVGVRAIADHSCVACRGIETECSTDTFYHDSSNITLIYKMTNKYCDEFLRRTEGRL